MKRQMLSSCRHLVVAGVFLLVATAGSFAQSNFGLISGTVSDPSRSPVAGCKVTVRRLQTGAESSVETLDSGLFTFPSLASGLYNISAEKAGFKQATVSNVALDAASSRTVNFELQLGAVSESVSVSADVEQIQSSSGDVGRLISNRQLSQIALNGRNYSQ